MPIPCPTDLNPADARPTRCGMGSLAALIWPLLGLTLATLLINHFDVDRRLARWAYAGDGQWRFADWGWVQLLYHYGMTPALVVGSIAAALWGLSLVNAAWEPHRPLAAFLALLLALGPGFVVHLVFKDHFGRPRPHEVRGFGGDRAFLPAGQPDFSQPGRSFPSGHAALGFYWLGGFVFWWDRHRRRGAWFLAVGLVYGGLMSAGRILQGAHWFSDTLWAAGIDYLVAWVLYRTLVGADPRQADGGKPEGTVPA